jgi:thioredoxin-like negative regulator of GroEL
MPSVGRRLIRFVFVAATALGVLGIGWTAWVRRGERAALAEIDEEIEGARFAIAARKLNDFLKRNPRSDEALFLLGMCEKERGQADAAAAAWERVAATSTFASQAFLGRVELLIDRGRFCDAEQLVSDAALDPESDGSGPSILLGPVYCQEGRIEEAERLIEARWAHLDSLGEGASEKAINLVRLHIELRRTIPPVDTVRAVLDQAARANADDDRIWLGRANLAIRLGSYDEAARLIEACLRSRPEDPAVWRARLDWALATGRAADVQDDLKHLPAETAAPALVPRLAAWMAARRGDAAAERRALERLVEIDPADLAARGRLIDLTLQSGDHARAAELRRQAAEIDELKALYHRRFDRNQPLRDAAEMARIAERLGREFEARVFLTVALAVDPGRNDLRRDRERLDRRNQARDWAGRSLADVLEHEATAPRSTSE